MKEIAILMATRKRLHTLKECVDAFYNTCADATSFEILLAFDTDDKVTSEAFREFLIKRNYLNVRLYEFERMGWEKQYVYLNNLTKHLTSATRWVCQWTDDQIVVEKGWDAALLSPEFLNSFVLPWFTYDNDSWANSNFPYLTVVPLDWLKVMGAFLHHQQTDWFVDKVAREFNLYKKHPALRVHNLKLPDAETSKKRVYRNMFTPEEKVRCIAMRRRLADYLGVIAC